jgi:hypothetical protein
MAHTTTYSSHFVMYDFIIVTLLPWKQVRFLIRLWGK